MNRRLTLSHLKIRTKLLISYATVFIMIIGLGSTIMYSILRHTVETNIEKELENATAAILNMVRTSVSVSIKNHLRAVAEKNLDIVAHLDEQARQGRFSLAEAKRHAADILLSQRIGTTGYIACVNSKGTMVLHPSRSLIGTDISHFDFVKEMIRKRQGYIEYQWKNPGEAHTRPKAMYMAYFAPWDWIITVSSYRKEFRSLVNVDDFRDSVLSQRFGASGYSFVTDRRGNVIIHPLLQGLNIFEQAGIPDEPLRTMLAKKNGKIVYRWKNPGETESRQKLVLFNYIPEYEWIVASSSYLDEVYRPLSNLARVIAGTVVALLALVLPLTFWISASITGPLARLTDRLTGSGGLMPSPEPAAPGDEVDHLTRIFNAYVDRLETSRRTLQAEIAERQQAEAALRISQERYRSVMQAAPDPIIVYDMKGRVTYVNRAFTDVFGWTEKECVGHKLDHFVPPETWQETRRGLDLITAGKPLASVETRRLTKSGRIIDVSIRGAVYRNQQGELLGSVIIHRDISELKRMEKEIMDISDQERQRIGQDLHDDLCPHLIGIEGLSKVLGRQLEPALPDAARMNVKITELIKDAIAKTRRLARGLCPVYLVDHGLESSLRELAVTTESVFGKACRFHCQRPVLLADNTAATHLFRIVQEAVNNAVRHSGAERIDIAMTDADSRLEISVADNGCGLDAAEGSPGMGLRIMGFRAKMIDAVLDIRKGSRQGTVVKVSLNPNLPNSGTDGRQEENPDRR